MTHPEGIGFAALELDAAAIVQMRPGRKIGIRKAGLWGDFRIILVDTEGMTVVPL